MKIQTLGLVLAAIFVSPVLANAQETYGNRVPVNHMTPQYGSTSAANADAVIFVPASSAPIKTHHITPH